MTLDRTKYNLKILIVTLLASVALQELHAQDNFDHLAPGYSEFLESVGDTGPSESSDTVDIPDLVIGDPVAMGSGCAQNSVASILSPDQKVLSVVFDDFTVEAGVDVGDTNRRQCRLVIPISVPQGYKMAVARLDFRGFSSTPPGAKALFATTYYNSTLNSHERGAAERKNEKIFSDAQPVNFFLSSGLATKPMWSECGLGFNFNIDSVLAAKSNEAKDQVLITLDSLDMGPTGAVYHLVWKTCGPGPRKVDENYRQQKRLEREHRFNQKRQEIENRQRRHKEKIEKLRENRKKKPKIRRR